MNQTLNYEIGQVMTEAVATGLFVSLCTIQVPDTNFDAAGAPSGTFVNATGSLTLLNGTTITISPTLVNVACMDAPAATGTIQATEVKALQEIKSKGIRHVLLDKAYPQILTLIANGQVRAVIDGMGYEVFGAEQDSQDTQTRLHLEKIKV